MSTPYSLTATIAAAITAAAQQIELALDAPHLAIIIDAGQTRYAWLCPSEDAALATLRRWYAARRAIVHLDPATGAIDPAWAEGSPNPGTATVEEISAWYGDDSSMVLIAPVEARDPQDVELQDNATIQDMRDTPDAHRAAVALVATATQVVTPAANARQIAQQLRGLGYRIEVVGTDALFIEQRGIYPLALEDARALLDATRHTDETLDLSDFARTDGRRWFYDFAIVFAEEQESMDGAADAPTLSPTEPPVGHCERCGQHPVAGLLGTTDASGAPVTAQRVCSACGREGSRSAKWYPICPGATEHAAIRPFLTVLAPPHGLDYEAARRMAAASWQVAEAGLDTSACPGFSSPNGETTYIIDPFVDETAQSDVDPLLYYGSAFLASPLAVRTADA